MKFLAFVIGFVALCNSAIAQDSTTVRFLVKGGEKYFIRLDGKLLPQTNIHTVSQEPHTLEVWSPKCDMYIGKMETGNLKETNHLVELKQSGSYTSFLADRENYKKQLFFKRTAPFFIGILSLSTLPITAHFRSLKHEELIRNEFYEKYKVIPSSTLQNTQLQYASLNALFFTSVIAAAASTAAFIGFRKQIKKLTPPVFRQQNPFTLEYIELTMNPMHPSPVGGVVLNF
jgi:hypothetical protein